MNELAFQKQYRQEWIKKYERRQSKLRDTVTTEAVIKGNQAEFMTVGTNGATTTTRGSNGQIPSRYDDLTQITCTLTEEHDLAKKQKFNIFAGQSDQRGILQQQGMAVVNRRVDQQIINQLDASTTNLGAAAQVTKTLINKAVTRLGNNEVEMDGSIYGIVTPAWMTIMSDLANFSSGDYVSKKPLDTGEAFWEDAPQMYRWMGVNWIVHTGLAGAGTANETCYIYHKSAIGHAMNSEGMDIQIGYNEEQDYSFARHSFFGGAKLLQNEGVIKVQHDASSVI